MPYHGQDTTVISEDRASALSAFWPLYEDGGLVSIGGWALDPFGDPSTVTDIRFSRDGVTVWLANGQKLDLGYRERVRRPVTSRPPEYPAPRRRKVYRLGDTGEMPDLGRGRNSKRPGLLSRIKQAAASFF